MCPTEQSFYFMAGIVLTDDRALMQKAARGISKLNHSLLGVPYEQRSSERPHRRS
jgi:hypothetical protein